MLGPNIRSKPIANPMLNDIVRMMRFLDIETYVIPHWNMELPEEAMGENFRPDKVFRLFKNGTMSYTGSGSVPKISRPDISIVGMKVPDRYLERSYRFMKDDCAKKIVQSTKNIKMDNAASLIVKFNKLSFIDINALLGTK